MTGCSLVKVIESSIEAAALEELTIEELIDEDDIFQHQKSVDGDSFEELVASGTAVTVGAVALCVAISKCFERVTRHL